MSVLHRFICLSIACALLAGAAAATACTLADGYLRPSNYELVRQTPRIVWARAVSSSRSEEPKPGEPIGTVNFEVLEVLKGTYPEKTLTADGDGVSYDGPGDLNSFDMARPGAQRGACNAYDYKIGTNYLLFLGNEPGDTTGMVGGPPFSRVNEEAAEGSAWLATVRHYVRISLLEDGAAQRSALLELQVQVKLHSGDPRYPLLLESDIARHFRTPSAHMSYEELLALYRQPPPYRWFRSGVLWAMAKGPKPEARPLFASMVQSGRWRTEAGAVTEFITRTQDRRLAAQLLAQLPATHDRWLRGSILTTAARVANASEQPRMLQALRSANAGERRVLAPWFVRYPSEAGTALLKRAVGSRYTQDTDLSLALASLGDADVLAWARQQMAIHPQPEHGWMAFYVIARSPLPQADELARQTIRQGDGEDPLMNLVQAYQDSNNPNRWARLADIVALRERGPKVNEWLQNVLKQQAEAGEPQAAELLRQLAAQPKGAAVSAPR